MVEKVERKPEVKQEQAGQNLTLPQIIFWCQEHGLLEELTAREKVVLENYPFFGPSNTRDRALGKILLHPILPEHQRVFILKLSSKEWAKDRLIELVKRQIAIGADKQLTSLQRNYLGLALGTNLTEKQISQKLGISLYSTNSSKARAFSKIFLQADENTKREVELVFLQSGLGRISFFDRYKHEREHAKKKRQRPKTRERMREYKKRPEVKRKSLAKQLELYRSIGREAAFQIVSQASTEQINFCLTEREILVIKARYKNPEKPLTLEELRERLGKKVSRERVRQIEQTALKKLLRTQTIKPTV